MPSQVSGKRGRVLRQGVAEVLVPRELARVWELPVERPERPRQPAVDVEPAAARPLGRVCRRGVGFGGAERDDRAVSTLGDVRGVVGGDHRRADPRWATGLADSAEEMADVANERRRLCLVRNPGQDRPWLRLPEDHAGADLRAPAYPREYQPPPVH